MDAETEREQTIFVHSCKTEANSLFRRLPNLVAAELRRQNLARAYLFRPSPYLGGYFSSVQPSHGVLDLLRLAASLVASTSEKSPEILPVPPDISLRIMGALISFPSRTMANCRPTFVRVISANCFLPLGVTEQEAHNSKWLPMEFTR